MSEDSADLICDICGEPIEEDSPSEFICNQCLEELSKQDNYHWLGEEIVWYD